MVKWKIKNLNTWKIKGDYVVSEVGEHFFPLAGSAQGIWSEAGEDKLSALRPDNPMVDYEIKETSAFNLKGKYPGGILHLKLPHFPPSDQNEGNRRLRQCYRVILEEAVEKNAMVVVFPFIGCFSVQFSYQHGIDIALRTMQEFISEKNTGKLTEIIFCTNYKSFFKQAIKHDVYKEQKRTQKSMLKTRIVPLATGAMCVFKTLDPTFDSHVVRLDCNDRFEKLSQLVYKKPIFGCEHPVDLLLLRGGIHIDWSDQDKGNVCENHKEKLLTRFEFLTDKKNRKKRLTCSLPEILHKGGQRPETSGRLQKLDALEYIASTGRFVPVGTAVCSYHIGAIKEGKCDMITFSKDSETRQESLPDGDISMVDLQQSLSEIESMLPDQADASFDHEMIDSSISDESMIAVVENIPPPPERYRDNPQRDRQRALRQLASLSGLDRLTGSWDTLKPETQRKKINGMMNLHIDLYKVCAGEFWEEMKEACMRKLKVIERDARVESLMEVVGQCLEDSNEKSVRISVVKLLTGLFTEKEIRAGTGASRYLIRQAKLSSFEEIRALNSSFNREKYNTPKVLMYLRFVARPEILVYVPNSCKKVKLSNGNEASLAAVARMYSYREIFRLFIRYCEELAKQNGMIAPSDVAEFVRIHALGYSSAYKLMEVISPIRQLRMSCVDSFQADAFEAFDEISLIVEELALLDEISVEKAMELRRRVRLAKNFIFGEMRTHIAQESDVISHCWTHALSDPEDPRFDSPCDHSHDNTCTECTEAMCIPSLMATVVRTPYRAAMNNKSQSRWKLGRMLEILTESDRLIKSYRKHAIRCVASENDRRKIIDSLEEGHAIIVADYAMKILPTDAVPQKLITISAVQAFSNLLETTEDAQMAVNSDSIVPLVYGDNSEERENGWALRKNETPKILLKVKTEVQRLVEVQLDGERRAEAKEIKEQLRELKNEDGSYKFHIDNCLTESQIKSQIIRIVKDRKKKKSGGNDDEKQVQSPKRGRKRKEEQVAKKKEQKKGGRPSKKSREMVEEEEEDMEGDTDDDVMDEQREEGSEEQIEEELDIIGIMKEAVDERRNEIFDPDEFEEEL